MQWIYIFATISIVLTIIYFTSNYHYKKILSHPTILIFGLGILVRVVAVYLFPSFQSDVAAFKQIAVTIGTADLHLFYDTHDFNAFPPVYAVILYFIGFLNAIFKFQQDGSLFLLLIKLPGIIGDLLLGFFLYRVAYKVTKPSFALILSFFYVLNPAVIFISAVWGQYDSIPTFFIVCAVYSLVEKDNEKSSIFYALALLAKPQWILCLPLFLVGQVLSLWQSKDTQWRQRTFLTCCFFGITIGILMQPFSTAALIATSPTQLFSIAGINTFLLLLNLLLFGIKIVIPQQRYHKLFSYVWLFSITFILTTGLLSFHFTQIYDQVVEKNLSFASINAYNLFTLLKANFVSLNTAFIELNNKSNTDVIVKMTYDTLGNIFLTCIVIFSVFLAFFKNQWKYYLAFAFFTISYFMFATQVHERYLYAAIIFLILSFVYYRDKRLLFLVVTFSVTYLVNCADVLYLSLNDNNAALNEYSKVIVSCLNMLQTGYFYYVLYDLCRTKDVSSIIVPRATPTLFAFRWEREQLQPSKVFTPFGKPDYLYMFGITIVYACIAFYRLGDTKAATIPFQFTKDHQQIVVALENPTDIHQIQIYLGPRNNIDLSVQVSDDGIVWAENKEIKLESVFRWAEMPLDFYGKYVMLTASSKDLIIMEMALRDADNKLIPIQSVSGNATALFDEQSLVPDEYSYMNSTYFDEVYYPRTNYEFLHHMEPYEWTHPQLGKDIQTVGVLLFGMNPFGWRFTGAFFGVLMLPLLYLFARRIFNTPKWALFTTIIFAFDFMHYTQTRIATIDTYVTFFIMGMYYFMYQYYKTNFYDTPLYKTLLLLFGSGLFMGLGIASKWPGVYAAVGLAILFFHTLFERYREYRYAVQQDIQDNRRNFYPYMYITLGCCIVFFIVIPVVIYFVAYIPHYLAAQDSNYMKSLIPKEEDRSLIRFVLQTQLKMFDYHAHLNDTHPYSSPWYSWLIDFKPIAYYFKTINVGDVVYKTGISAFGNPALWWGGLVALFYSISRLSRKYSATLVFLLVAYFAQLIPWTLITTRTTFIYHYFPCVPFLALLVGYLFKDYVAPKKKFAPYIYLGVVIVLFAMYYPVISGTPVNPSYVEYILRWFPTWYLIS